MDDFFIELRGRNRQTEAQEELEEENLLDFTFDGVVHFGSRTPEGGRSKIIQLQKIVDSVLSRESHPMELDAPLKTLLQNVESAIAQHTEQKRANPKEADLNDAYIDAYSRAREALGYMSLYIDSKRVEHLTQGMLSLDSAVGDIDELIASESSPP